MESIRKVLSPPPQEKKKRCLIGIDEGGFFLWLNLEGGCNRLSWLRMSKGAWERSLSSALLCSRARRLRTTREYKREGRKEKGRGPFAFSSYLVASFLFFFPLLPSLLFSTCRIALRLYGTEKKKPRASFACINNMWTLPAPVNQTLNVQSPSRTHVHYTPIKQSLVYVHVVVCIRCLVIQYKKVTFGNKVVGISHGEIEFHFLIHRARSTVGYLHNRSWLSIRAWLLRDAVEYVEQFWQSTGRANDMLMRQLSIFVC